MTQYITPLRKKLFLLLVPVLVGIVYLGGTVLSSSPKKDKSIIRINNLTRSFEVLSAKKYDGHLNLSLRNNSNKAITAYVFTSRMDPQTVFTFSEDFAFSEVGAVIAPGQDYEKTIGISNTLNRRNEVVLALSAIIFEDNTGEGDPKAIRDIQDDRLGQKIQIMKALPVLDKLLRLSDTALVSYWNKTARQDFEVALDAPNTDALMKLNKKPINNGEPYNENESEQFKTGTQTAKESILQKYQEMTDSVENLRTDLRQSIIRLRDLYAEMITRF